MAQGQRLSIKNRQGNKCWTGRGRPVFGCEEFEVSNRKGTNSFFKKQTAKKERQQSQKILRDEINYDLFEYHEEYWDAYLNQYHDYYWDNYYIDQYRDDFYDNLCQKELSFWDEPLNIN